MMTEPVSCKLCGAAPAVNRSKRPLLVSGSMVARSPKEIAEAIKANAERPKPKSENRCVSLQCTSGAHPMVIVKTHECGDEDSAVQVWNEAMA
jgi:hypothetical protein